ncbi:EamA family transporter [Candidatus Dojkabacteria bacterium]|nr:EamA family transporter [Candidatus Dojkabacteria bacterium]
MSWQIFITISIVFNSFASLVNRQLMKTKKNDSYLFAIVFQAAGAFLILLIGLILGRISFPNLSPVFFHLFLMTLLYGIGSVLVFESYKRVEASNFTIVFAMRVIVVIVASRLFLGEILQIQQFIGAALVLSGVIIVTVKNTRFNFSNDIIYVLMATLAFGLAGANDKYILDTVDIDVFSFLVLGFFLPVIPMLLIKPKSFTSVPQLIGRRNLGLIGLLVVLYVIQALGFYFAVESVDISIVASVNQITDVLTVVLAIVLLGETDGLLRKLIGAGTSFAGLLLI